MRQKKSESVNWKTQTCSKCQNLTNVTEESRKEPNVMGGCFVDGHITFTDCAACKHFDLKENETDSIS